MGSKAGNRRRGRLSPAAATAVAAGAAATAVSCCALVLWRLAPSFAAPLLVVSPAFVALAAWFAARRAVHAALKPAAEALDRLAAQDFASAPTVAADFETAGLEEALERCRGSLSAHHEAVRAHAAVARLMGAGVGRLARGDGAVRVSVDLPEPYGGFGRDFNAAAERLGAALADLDALRARLGGHAAVLDEAAARLGKRADSLAARIETDLRIIDALARHDPAEALRIARHTMQGVGVAARRNAEAAAEFAGVGRLIGEEAATPAAPAADDPAAPAGIAA